MKVWRILIIHPNNDNNIGDIITYLGSRNLFTNAVYGPQFLDIVQFDIQRAIRELDTYITNFCWGQVDIIALAGAPWIANKCEGAGVNTILHRAIKRWPEAKVIALGIGGWADKNTFETCQIEKQTIDKLAEIYHHFDYICVRDRYAQDILSLCGIPSVYTYDTSLYAYRELSRNGRDNCEKKVLFFYDPSTGCSADRLTCNPEEYIQYQLDWAKQNDADIFCNDPRELQVLHARGIEGTFCVDLRYLSYKLTEYNEMLSGRVHMAVFGFLANIMKITLLPVDSRFQTVLKLGIDVHFLEEPWKYKSEIVSSNLWKDIRQEENNIVSSIRSVLFKQ